MGMNVGTLNCTDSDESVALIEKAIELEGLQYAPRSSHWLRYLVDNLRKAIDQRHSCYRKRFSQAFLHVSIGHPENETLELPSSYALDLRRQFVLGGLASLEYEIRLDHAYDSVDDIRTAIHIYNTMQAVTRNGTKYSVRNQKLVHGELSAISRTIFASVQNDMLFLVRQFSHSAFLQIQNSSPSGITGCWEKI